MAQKKNRPEKVNKNYRRLVSDLYRENDKITLPSEYGYFAKHDLARLLIRLARYKFVSKMVRPDDNILEVGCGSGLGTIFLGQFCRSIKGIDIYERELLEAKSINRRKNVTFQKGDIFDYSGKETYDCIVALDVIEHLSERCGRKFIEQISRMLNDDGMMIIGTPSVYSYPYQGKLSRAAHVKLYDQDELITLIENYYGRAVAFSMNDELVHTGFHKMAWYYFVLAFLPKRI